MKYEDIETAFKNNFPNTWETELRDFMHGFPDWYEAILSIEIPEIDEQYLINGYEP